MACKLPYRPGMDGILIAISGRKRGPKPIAEEINAMGLDWAKGLMAAVEAKDAARVWEAFQLGHKMMCELMVAERDEDKDMGEGTEY